MTVLHVLDHSVPVPSGYSVRSLAIVRFQRRLGLRPVVLTSPKQGGARDAVETIEGITHYRTGAVGARGPLVRELASMARLAARIARVARGEQARILHAHSPLLNGLPALLAGRRLGLPVVYEARAFWEDAAVDHGTCRERSLRYRLTRALESRLFRGVDHVVTICEAMRQDILARGVAAAHVSVVPNGVDAEWFSPRPRSEAVAQRLGLGEATAFGFVGSFFRYEGLRFLVEAVPELRAAVPGATLVLVGSGEEEPALRRIAARLDAAVRFTGHVPHGEIRDLYSVIDVMVCPRRRMRLTELTTPLKPLEAMAMGRPVLASDVGGMAELVAHERTGLLFRAESRASLVAAAARLGADRDLRARLGAAARSAVVKERGWTDVVARYLPVYGRLAGAPA